MNSHDIQYSYKLRSKIHPRRHEFVTLSLTESLDFFNMQQETLVNYFIMF